MNVRRIGIAFLIVMAGAIEPVTAAAPEATSKLAAMSRESGSYSDSAGTLVNRILDRWYPIAGETQQDVALWRAQFGAILRRTSIPTLVAIDAIEAKDAGPNRTLMMGYQRVVAMAVSDLGARMVKDIRDATTAKLGTVNTDLVFVPVSPPCRIVDTRLTGLGISFATQRNFYFYSDATPASWSSQGGDAGGVATACPGTTFTSAGGTLGNAPPYSVMANVTAVNTTAAGNFIAWGGGGNIPNTSVLNWDHAGEIISATTTIPWGGRSGGNLDFTVRYNGPSGFSDVVVDVMGYFVENAATALDCTTATASGPIDIGIGSDTTINYPACPSGYTRTGGYCNGGASTGTSGIYVVETGAAACVFRNLGGASATGNAISQCCRVPGR